MADYYLYPIGRLIESALPGGLNVKPFKTGCITLKGETALRKLKLQYAEKQFLEWVQKNPGKRLSYPFTIAVDLQKKGWIEINSRQNRCVGPLLRKFVRPKDDVDLKKIIREKSTSFKAKNETEFLSILYDAGNISLTELRNKFPNGSYLVNKWVKADIIETYDCEVARDPSGKIMCPAPVPENLFDQQEEALSSIKTLLNKGTFATCLLHGVTGSGKTEVYYHAIQHAIQLGKQSILMAPEIALAVYMEGTFRYRLGNRVAIFHSALSRGERYDQWMKILRGEIDLVIGARSALFAPLPRLGLIIVDEEFDFAYKQEENPRYQARDSAVVRGKMERALVILGSGTPSVQSFHNTTTNRYHLLSMPERVEKRPLPGIEIVDMKDMQENGHDKDFFSPQLKEALGQNLIAKKQSILFLNRRGFSRVYLCRSCGEAIKCLNCDLTLTYHFKDNNLICHYCGFNSQPLEKCPLCGNTGMRAYGFGTEKLEQELKEMFPDARVARFDRDSTRRKGESFTLLKRFAENEIDILVGTQMITKGYDFPDVTLVGIIAADLSLGFPDFRAGERTFQIISQVAGRAGRGEENGRVIVQTFNPGHYAITTARDHDYETFYQKEKELREQLGYPPFSYLACLRFQGNNQDATARMAQLIGDELNTMLKKWPKRGKEIQILGPVEAPLSKLKGKYRWQILVKSRGAELLHYFLNRLDELSKNRLRNSGVRLVIDVDPYQML